MKTTATSEVDYSKHFDQIRIQQEYIPDEDASRKSSIDLHCLELVNSVNASPNYFTTSSCSGRFLAFAQDDDVHVKKNCQWLKVTHDPLSDTDISDFVDMVEREKTKYDQIFLKFEPFILHVCCRDLRYAKIMLEQAIASGYRNSGISLGSTKIILAIRSTQNMEAPISCGGKLLVDRNYIEYICRKANFKFSENFERINRLHQNLKSECFAENKKGGKRAEKANQRLEKREYYSSLKNAGLLKTGNEINIEQQTFQSDQDKNESNEDCVDLFE